MNFIMRTRHTAIFLSIVALVSITTAGCIQRRMTVKSEPPGAKVFLDGIDVGSTPVTVPFTSYGWREILLELDEYQVQKNIVRIRAPWYSFFPIDFFTDVLYPGTITDERTFSFVMSPLEPEDMEAFQERAEDFAERSRKMLEQKSSE